jgi:hypothetical protein
MRGDFFNFADYAGERGSPAGTHGPGFGGAGRAINSSNMSRGTAGAHGGVRIIWGPWSELSLLRSVAGSTAAQ